MYRIEFFTADNGECDIGDWLDDLEKRAETDKDARVQLKQVRGRIRYLAEKGTRGSEDIIKFLQDGIWELRPGNNRVMLFHYENGTYVLLHHFRKKGQKTPPAELERAKRERDMYNQQQGGQCL